MNPPWGSMSYSPVDFGRLPSLSSGGFLSQGLPCLTPLGVLHSCPRGGEQAANYKADTLAVVGLRRG